MLSLWIATGVVTLVAAADASAATITLERVQVDKQSSTTHLYYRAAPGERNDLVVTREATDLVVTDRAPITPAPGCSADSEGSVRCPDASITGVKVFVSDGNDRVRLTADLPGWLYGGDGDDRLYAPHYDFTVFRGGFGDDLMVGGPRPSRFLAGRRRDGSDTMIARDRLDLPYSGSEVNYYHRRRGVHADTEGDRDDGEAGERDRIAGPVTEVTGGRGDDVLLGSPADDSIDGRTGHDLIRGGGGNDDLSGGDPLVDLKSRGPRSLRKFGDTIFGGGGDDELEGGIGVDNLHGGSGYDWVEGHAGADRIRVRDGAPDVVLCGPGRDLAVHDPGEYVESCERHGLLHRTALPVRWGLNGRSAYMHVGCPPGRGSCRGRLLFEENGTPIGEAGFDIPEGSRADAHFFLSRQPSGAGGWTVTVISSTPRGETRERLELIRCPALEALGNCPVQSLTGMPASRMRSFASRTLYSP